MLTAKQAEIMLRTRAIENHLRHLARLKGKRYTEREEKALSDFALALIDAEAQEAYGAPRDAEAARW